MERTIAAGFASPYFITQPDRAVAYMAEPAVLFCRRAVTLSYLAAWLGAWADRPASAPSAVLRPPPRPGERVGEERALKALREIVECGKPAEALPFPHPLLVMAEGLDKLALAALLVVKLRGLCQTLAVEASGGRFDVAETRHWLVQGLTTPPGPILSARDGDLAGFGQVRGLWVVSGMTETVLSSEGDCARILARHPNLPQQGPLRDPHAPASGARPD